MAIIAVSGHLGAGKTTACNRLAQFLGYKNSYTGDIFRQLAKDKGLSIEEYYTQIFDTPELEREIDSRQEKLMLSETNLIAQGRMAPFLFSNLNVRRVNVFFKVSDEEGARRQLKRPENQGKTFEEMLRLSRERTRQERRRYQSIYGINNYLDEERFDIVIDTTELNEEGVYQELLARLAPLI